MDILVNVMVSTFFYVVCGACVGAVVGWSLTYLWCHPEQTPPRIVDSTDPRTWAELRVREGQPHKKP